MDCVLVCTDDRRITPIGYVVGAGNFAHCIASSCEILVAVLTGHASWWAYARWLGPVVAGNICGGVGIVTVLEYGQAVYGKDEDEVQENAEEIKEQPIAS